jgi:predicted esterase
MRWLVLFGAIALPACGDQVNIDPSAASAAATGPSATSSSGSGAGPTAPDPRFLPKAAGNCPSFAAGKAIFSPSGIEPRDVLLFGGTATMAGPLVFFWHGAGGDPSEATAALGAQVIDAITAAGGIVAAPYHDPKAGQLPWYLTTGAGQQDDLLVADEVVACALAANRIDVRRIHSIGFSAGALHTVQLSYRRSGYIASVVPYSGGKFGNVAPQEEHNKFAAMIFHGGAKDQVLLNFKEQSEAYWADLKERGHFAFICDHGKGHTVPFAARASAWQFLQDHPFGTSPSPYAGQLPPGVPDYCAL